MDMMSLRRRVMVNQNKLMTATGNPITFNTPLTKPLKECVVRFTPQQSGSGTPSPENVREIVGKSSITVYQQGDDGVTHETSVSFPATVGDNGVVYGGYLDAENGEVVQEYYTFTLDGTNNKLGSGGTINNYNECEAFSYFGRRTLSNIPSGRGTSYTQLYSNILPTVERNKEKGEVVQADNLVQYIRVQLFADTIGVASGATSTEVIDAINTWLTAHPMQVCYPLRDPIHYSLTPQSIATLKGANTMWSDANGDITIKYWTR